MPNYNSAEMLLVILVQTTVLLIVAQHNLTPYGTASQSSSYQKPQGNAEYAIYPPASNTFTYRTCSTTVLMQANSQAWWMFQFSFGLAHITDITVYYRKGFAIRMDGFQLYVTNTSYIPPHGYRCYADPDPGFPNITQTIPCNQLGKYVIYYDKKASDEGNSIPGPIVELCYVAINGCRMSYWGSNCDNVCPDNCIGQHCYFGNGSCVWGCNAKNCLGNNCNSETSVCTEGCNNRRTGHYCNKYNMASDSLISQYPNGSELANKSTDGYKRSCSRTQGHKIIFQVDLNRESIVTGIYLTLGELTTKNGMHSVYASNTSTWTNGIVLYNETVLPKEIHFNEVFRYLTYLPTIQGLSFDLEVCEFGIIGCPPTHYGPFCDKTCPANCYGPCDLETGLCIFGCLNGWIGDECKQECPNGRFGRNCSGFCEGCISTLCDNVNGLCDNKTSCKPGYAIEKYCNTKCPKGSFGRNCSRFCEGCISTMCDNVNGLCDNKTSCKPGYAIGEYCNTTCSSDTYGKDCLQACSTNCLNPTCNRINGECIGQCNDGWKGLDCTIKCPNGTFGRNCSGFCDGCISTLCDNVNGLCDNKTSCKPGYEIREYCNTICDDWYFGNNCTKQCHCLEKPCNNDDGICSPDGCKEGWHGKSCDQVSTVTDENKSLISIQIGLFIGGFLLGIMMTAAACYLGRKRRKLRKNQGKDNNTEKTYSHEQQQYDDDRMENISTYQDLMTRQTTHDYEHINTAFVRQ